LDQTGHMEVLALVDGAVTHISQLDISQRGKRCDAVCAYCRTRLWAKMGSCRAWHFSHPSGLGCGHGTETALHLEAKRILGVRKSFRTPPASFEFDGEREGWIPSEQVLATHVKIEQGLGGLVPDVRMVRDGMPDFLVEIRVEHACPDDKVELIRSRALPCVEVDVRRIRLDSTTFDRDALERLLVDDEAPECKGWLNLPGYEEELDRRRLERQRIDAERALQAAAQRDAQRRAAGDSAHKADEARQQMARRRSGWSEQLDTDATWNQNRAILGIRGAPPEFLSMSDIQGSEEILCPPPTWQSEVWAFGIRRVPGELCRTGDVANTVIARHPDWFGRINSREIAFTIARYFNRLARTGIVQAVRPHYGNDPESWVWELKSLPRGIR
jgi:hypothetical protein